MRRRFRYFVRLYRRWRHRFQRFRHLRKGLKGNHKLIKRDVEKWAEEQPFVKYDYLDYRWEAYTRPYGDIPWHEGLIQKQKPPEVTKSWYFKFGSRYEIDLPSHIKPHHHHDKCTCMGVPTPTQKQSKGKRRSKFQSYSREVRQRFIMNNHRKRDGSRDEEEGKFLGADASLRRHSPSSKHSSNTRQYKAKTFHGCPSADCSCQVVKEFSAQKEAEQRERRQQAWERQIFEAKESTPIPPTSSPTTDSKYVPQPFRLHYQLLEKAMSSSPKSEKPDKHERVYFGRSFSYSNKDKSKRKSSSDMTDTHTRIDRNKKHSRAVSVPDESSISKENETKKDQEKKHDDFHCKVEGCSCRIVEEYSRQMEKQAQDKKRRELRKLARDNEANLKKESDQGSSEQGSSKDGKDGSKDNEREEKKRNLKDEEDKDRSFYQKLFALGRKSKDKTPKSDKKKKHIPVLFERRPDAEETRYKVRPSKKLTRQSTSSSGEKSPASLHCDHSPCSCKSVKEYTRKKDKEYIEQWKKDVEYATKDLSLEEKSGEDFDLSDVNVKQRHTLQRHHSEPGRRTTRKSVAKKDPGDPSVDIVIHKGYQRDRNKDKHRRVKSAGAEYNAFTSIGKNFQDSGVFSHDPFELGPWDVQARQEENIEQQNEMSSEYPKLDVNDWDPEKKPIQNRDSNTAQKGINFAQNNMGRSSWIDFDDDNEVNWDAFRLGTSAYSPNNSFNMMQMSESIHQDVANQTPAVLTESGETSSEYPPLDVNDWTPVKQRYESSGPTQSSNTGLENTTQSNPMPKPPSAADIYNEYADQFKSNTETYPSTDTVYLPPEEWTPVKTTEAFQNQPFQDKYIAAQPLQNLVPDTPADSGQVLLRQSNISRDSGCFSMSSPTNIAFSSLEFSIPEEASMGLSREYSKGTNEVQEDHGIETKWNPIQFDTHATGGKELYIAHNENALNEMSVVRKVKSKQPKSKKKSWTSIGAKLRKAKYDELHEVPNDHSELYDEWDRIKDEEEIDTTERQAW